MTNPHLETCFRLGKAVFRVKPELLVELRLDLYDNDTHNAGRTPTTILILRDHAGQCQSLSMKK